MSILVVSPIGIGNFIMCTPALFVLSKNVKDEDVHFLALRNGVADMAKESFVFSHVHIWDPDKESLLVGIKLLCLLRKFHYSAIIFLFPTKHWKFQAFTSLLKYQKKYCFSDQKEVIRKKKKILLPTQDNLHDVMQNKKIVSFYLDHMETKKVEISHISEQYERLSFFVNKQKLSKLKETTKPYFVCHLGSSSQRGMIEKRAPLFLFAMLIHFIYDEFGFMTVPIIGPEEKDIISFFEKEIKQEAWFNIPTKGLADVKEVIRGSEFFLGNDSGIMHMAICEKKRCISFFGPSDEMRTGPYYINNNDVNSGNFPSRGHLILRNPKEKNVSIYKKNKPSQIRLKNEKTHKLFSIDPNWVLEEVNAFIKKNLL